MDFLGLDYKIPQFAWIDPRFYWLFKGIINVYIDNNL